MKPTTVAFLLASALVYAQAPSFRHILVLIQENRTPDDLFYACKIPGSDLRTTGTAVSITYGGGTMSHSHRAYLKELKGQYPSGSNNYVVATDIQPYCQLAKQHGFGNYVFQTNQGPSLPAHQFLLSGSSSPTETSDLFASDNGLPKVGYGSCNAPSDAYVPTIVPDGTYGPGVFPCFTRSSIIDNLQAAKLTWKYYAVSSKPFVGWTDCNEEPLPVTE
jgi:phospholipase C